MTLALTTRGYLSAGGGPGGGAKYGKGPTIVSVKEEKPQGRASKKGHHPHHHDHDHDHHGRR